MSQACGSSKRSRKDELAKSQKSKAKKAKKRQQVNVNHIIKRLQGISSDGGVVDLDVVSQVVQLEVRRFNHECFIPDWMWKPLFDFQSQAEIDWNLTLCKAAVPAARRKTDMNKNLLEELVLKKVPDVFSWYLDWGPELEYGPDHNILASDSSNEQKFGDEDEANSYCFLVVCNFFRNYIQKQKLQLLERANIDAEACTKESCQAMLNRYLANSVDDSKWPGCKWKTKKARDKSLEQWRSQKKRDIERTDQHASLLSLIIDTFRIQENTQKVASGLEETRYGPPGTFLCTQRVSDLWTSASSIWEMRSFGLKYWDLHLD